ncbi:MAG: DUF2723 domain-containing protein [Anaerolineae bacterium]|nr:DUF2723 domain-containing protein [Anaerolineae bacterium]
MERARVTRRISALWPLAPILVVLPVYWATLAPGLTWKHSGADGGDLLTAALTNGVPHPSGYPTYILLLRAVMKLPGHTPAFWGNLFSALSATLALIFVALASARVLRDVGVREGTARLVAIVTAVLTGLGPTLWSQAVITEVYSLHACFVAILIYLLLRTDVKAGGIWGLTTGLVLGLGLGNHISLAFLIPGAVIYLWLADIRVTRRSLLGLALGCVVGLLTYVYLPWAARGDPPVNWGDPSTLPRLWWLVSGRVYRRLIFAFPLSWIPWRLSGWAGLLLQNLTLPGVALALFGLWQAKEELPGLFGMTLAHVGVFSIYALGYDTADSYVYLIPVYIALAPCLALGAWVIGGEAVRRATGHGVRLRRAVGIILAVSFVILPVAQAWSHWDGQDLSQDHEAVDFGRDALATADSNALIIVATDQPTFTLWYFHYGLGLRPDVTIINSRLYEFDWYRDSVTRRYPSIVLAGGRVRPPTLNEVIAANMKVRPVYLAELILDPLMSYSAKRQGPLYRLQSHAQ